MKKLMPIWSINLVLFTPAVFGHCMQNAYYAGGGLALSTLPRFQRATGLQFMGGYCLPYNFNHRSIKTSVELGYFEMGEFKGINADRSFQGLWSTGVIEYKTSRKIHFLGRGGLDFGGDNGLVYGMGMAVNLTKFTQMRSEYVFRDKSKSVQFGIITEFK